MFNWTKGRQNTGYEKLRIFQFLNMDCYILRYKVGDSIPWHTDPVPGRKHFRLNFTLKNAEEGGNLIVKHPIKGFHIDLRDCLFLFRSDVVTHSVTEIKKGTRIVLTFGIAI